MSRLLTFNDFRREYLPQTETCPRCHALLYPGEPEHRHPRDPLAEAIAAGLLPGKEDKE